MNETTAAIGLGVSAADEKKALARYAAVCWVSERVSEEHPGGCALQTAVAEVEGHEDVVHAARTDGEEPALDAGERREIANVAGAQMGLEDVDRFPYSPARIAASVAEIDP